jgi:flagellar assembly protein FliH
MSSKLHRAGDNIKIAPVEWRAAGGQATPARQGGASIPEARITELQQEAEARVRAAYNQGVAAGEASAQQHAQQKVEPVVHQLNGMINELAALRKRVRAEAEDDAMKLAIAIARRLIYRELSTDPDAILGLVKAAFGKLNARETHRLRVSPSDAAIIQENRARMQFPPGLDIVPDAALMPGSAIFETSRGDLDASVDTQLSEIDRGLTDVMKRRK